MLLWLVRVLEGCDNFTSYRASISWLGGETEGGNPQLMVACDLTEEGLALTGWDIQTG